MKNIAIIGTGLAGLRAGVELSKLQNVSLTFLEKSASVGGRIATRRFGDISVNHGTESFDDLLKLAGADPLVHELLAGYTEGQAVTVVAKKMRDRIQASSPAERTFYFNTKVKTIAENGTVTFEDGSYSKFDHVLMTSPVPQTRELLGKNLLPEIEYSKKMLLIGSRNGESFREVLQETFTREYFEFPENEILDLLRSGGKDIAGLAVKKWRYAEVLTGHPESFVRLSEAITLAGDAFDPRGIYGLSSAWFSGLSVARAIIQQAE